MANKMTKKEMYAVIKGVVEQYGNQDMVDFIDHEVELLNKKSANKKATKTQEENEGIKAIIVATLDTIGKAVTVTELQSADDTLNTLSNQRVSALLRQLVEVGKVTKTVDKKKSYFSIATE